VFSSRYRLSAHLQYQKAEEVVNAGGNGGINAILQTAIDEGVLLCAGTKLTAWVTPDSVYGGGWQAHPQTVWF
jgi:hypothetical protein